MEAMRKTDPCLMNPVCGWKGLRVVVVVVVCISRSLSIAFGWGQIMRGDNGNRCVRLCGSLARNAHSSGPLNSTVLHILYMYVLCGIMLNIWYRIGTYHMHTLNWDGTAPSSPQPYPRFCVYLNCHFFRQLLQYKNAIKMKNKATPSNPKIISPIHWPPQVRPNIWNCNVKWRGEPFFIFIQNMCVPYEHKVRTYFGILIEHQKHINIHQKLFVG